MSSLGVRSIKSCSAGRVRFPYEPSQPGSDYHFCILPSRIADAPGVLPKANSNWEGSTIIWKDRDRASPGTSNAPRHIQSTNRRASLGCR